MNAKEQIFFDVLECPGCGSRCGGNGIRELVLKAILDAVAEEREACAKLADKSDAVGYFTVKDLWSLEAFRITKKNIANAIRAREGAP